jgi:hypothetical protein
MDPGSVRAQANAAHGNRPKRGRMHNVRAPGPCGRRELGMASPELRNLRIINDRFTAPVVWHLYPKKVTSIPCDGFLYSSVTGWPKEEGLEIATGPVSAVDVTDGRRRQAFAELECVQ